jgi:hypothetical protein
MSRTHRHHHAITAGRSAREYQQNVNAQAAEKIRAAAELLTDASALLRHQGLALRAFELGQMAKDLQPQTPDPKP